MQSIPLPRSLALGVSVLLLLVGAGVGGAAETIRVSVPAGTTILEAGGQQVEVQTTQTVIVTLQVSGDVVQGSVELVAGTKSASVTITLLGPPNRVIFSGRVTGNRPFRDYLPQETGQGEM